MSYQGVPPTSSLFSNFLGLVHVGQLTGSIMMPKEAQFTEVLVRQNCLNCSKFPHTFCIGHFGGTRQKA